MQLMLGMSPISWSNDDLPKLGGETPLSVCLQETRAAGYTGTETGGKFPKTAKALSDILQEYQLALVSGWYSGLLAVNDIQTEIERITPQLTLFRDVGARVIVYGETYQTIQNQQHIPLAQRPKLSKSDFPVYAQKLTQLAEYCETFGVPLSLHHHMGTMLETQEDIDALMEHTGEALKLLLDTGHLCFSGGHVLPFIEKYGKKINHVHAKNVRSSVLHQVQRDRQSFLDTVLDGIFTVPGDDGMIDYQEVLMCLHAQGYEGWVVVEAEQDPARANPFKYAKMAYAALYDAAVQAGYEIVSKIEKSAIQ